MEESLRKHLIALIDWVYAKKIRNDIVLTQYYIIELIRKLNDIIKHQKKYDSMLADFTKVSDEFTDEVKAIPINERTSHHNISFKYVYEADGGEIATKYGVDVLLSYIEIRNLLHIPNTRILIWDVMNIPMYEP